MAEVVGVVAASHTPVLTNMPDAPERDIAEQVYQQFTALGEKVTALKPDVLLLVSDDHLHNFFLNNLPAFCIGAADRYDGPVEAWLKVPAQDFSGQSELGAYLVDAAFDAGFDPALSMELTLDHAFVTPLSLMGLSGIPIVPLYVNCVQPPLPRMQRCIDFGQALGRAIESYSGQERVVVVATGGLSHDVGTPQMGALNEDFDRRFLELLQQGRPGPLAEFSQTNVDSAGNGAEEVRAWLLAHGISRCRGFSTLYYHPVQAWYTGIAFGTWELQ